MKQRKRSWLWAKASLVGTGSHTAGRQIALAPPLENPRQGASAPPAEASCRSGEQCCCVAVGAEAGPRSGAPCSSSAQGRPGHRRRPASAPPYCLLPVARLLLPYLRAK